MNEPLYSQDPIYQKLAFFCEQCGLKIEYVAPSDTCRGRTEGICIQMQPDEEYKNATDAALVLGHELAHSLEDRFYIDAHTLDEYGVSAFPSDNVELPCDCWGTALYKLALLMVGTSAEHDFMDACKIAHNGQGDAIGDQ